MILYTKRNATLLVATLVALLILSASISSAGQSYHPQLPFKLPTTLDWTSWTEEECDAIFFNSGWASTLNGKVVRLQSALPVREALLRGKRLDKHYDAMNPQEKLAFDQENPADMIEHEDDPIVLFVEQNHSYYNPPRTMNAVEIYPDPILEAALRLADGTFVMPIKIEALADGFDGNIAVYSFPRFIDGKPVFTADQQELAFFFGRPLRGGGRIRKLQDPKKFRPASNGRVAAFFGATGLMYNGKLEY
jgi:hypothetical protein